MEITIDLIEKVLDATNADYRTVKQALVDHDGNVEEAIKDVKEKMEAENTKAASSDAEDVSAEDTTNPAAEGTGDGETSTADNTDHKEEETVAKGEEGDKDVDPVEELFSDEYADKVVEKLKDRVKAGNVDRIRISKGSATILDVPVNVGLIGGLVGLLTVPWAMILAAIAAFGMKCKVEVISQDGKSEEV